MHAVVVRVSIKDADGAQKALEEQVVPRVKQAPGFVAGYWTRSDDRSNGQGMIVFDSEDAARAAADQLRANVPDPVTLGRTKCGRTQLARAGLPVVGANLPPCLTHTLCRSSGIQRGLEPATSA
jgi:hypothetical protein